MTARPIDPLFQAAWQRLDVIESKVDGVFAVAIAICELMLDSNAVLPKDITDKMTAMRESLHEPAKSSHTGKTLQVAASLFQEKNPKVRKGAALELIQGGKSESPEEPH